MGPLSSPPPGPPDTSLLSLHFVTLIPLLLRLIVMWVLLTILTLRVSTIVLPLVSPIALVVILILWLEVWATGRLLLLLVVLLRIRRHLGLIELLLGIIRIERLGSRIRNEDRSRISSVWGNERGLLLSILEKRDNQLSLLGVIYPLSDIILVPVEGTNLLEVWLHLHVLRILIDWSLGPLNWILHTQVHQSEIWSLRQACLDRGLELLRLQTELAWFLVWWLTFSHLQFSFLFFSIFSWICRWWSFLKIATFSGCIFAGILIALILWSSFNRLRAGTIDEFVNLLVKSLACMIQPRLKQGCRALFGWPLIKVPGQESVHQPLLCGQLLVCDEFWGFHLHRLWRLRFLRLELCWLSTGWCTFLLG